MQTRQRIKLNLSSRSFRDDPWTSFSRLREMGPVIQAKVPLLGKCWVATTYDAVNQCLKESDRFVRNPSSAGRKTFVQFQWMIPRSFMALSNNMLASDGQDHRRLRSLVDQAFARRNIDSMSDRIERIALDQLEIANSHVENGKVDLVEHFAQPLPLTVICELLGLPLEDRAKFKQWFAPLANANSVWSLLAISSGVRKLVRYLKALFQRVRQSPCEGLVSELVQAEHDGQQLTESELLAMVFLLLVAGHETTVHLIVNSVYALLVNPDAKSRLMADGSLLEAAIEEVLRYAAPIQIAKPRFVAQDTQFFGQKLKRGELLIPLLASANYDPARFENPHQFDIDRKSNYHLTFGSGPHVCLGMKLARNETYHAIQALFDRWPDLRAAFDLSAPDWSRRIGVRGMKSLVIQTHV